MTLALLDPLKSKLPTVRGVDLLVESQGPYSRQIILRSKSKGHQDRPLEHPLIFLIDTRL
jgi:hypothetical protein